MHFFNWMVKSFNFLIVPGYPEYWLESVNNQLHVYGSIQAVLNALQCLWNCYHLSYKYYASHTFAEFTIDIWTGVIVDLWFRDRFHRHEQREKNDPQIFYLCAIYTYVRQQKPCIFACNFRKYVWHFFKHAWHIRQKRHILWTLDYSDKTIYSV